MKKTALHENKSLKTFFVYTAIVLFFIFISLSVKAVFVIQASKFDGRHHFLLSVNKDQIVKQIIAFDPSTSEVAVLKITGDAVLAQTSNQEIGYIPDAMVEMGEKYDAAADTSKILRTIGFHYNSVQTDLTLFDIIRLAILSHKTLEKQQLTTTINGSRIQNDNDIKNFFSDDAIISEDITIQVVNASGESGLGRRLETVLSSLGYNVVSITTAAKKEEKSKIEYYGDKSYTLQKIEKILKFPIVELDKKQIADIIVTIGEESNNSNTF